MRHSMLLTPGASVALTCFGLGLTSTAQDDRLTKTVTLPPDRVLGHYYALPDGRPRRLSLRKAQEEQLAGRKDPELPGGDLRGVISYERGMGLAIGLADDDQGAIESKLKALRVVDPGDIHWVDISAKVDTACLSLISRYERLRDLTMVVDEDLEGNDACGHLERLKNLTYLNISCRDTCVFGSKRFCTTVLALKRLTYLSIPCEKLTDGDVAMLATHPALEIIYLRSRRPVLGSKSLQALQKMANLRELFVVCTEDVRDVDIMGFAEIKPLETFGIATKAPLTCQARIKDAGPIVGLSFRIHLMRRSSR